MRACVPPLLLHLGAAPARLPGWALPVPLLQLGARPWRCGLLRRTAHRTCWQRTPRGWEEDDKHSSSVGSPPQVTLSTNDPQSAIADIQQRGALQDPRCRPLLGLLDQLGLTRWVLVHAVPTACAHAMVNRGAGLDFLVLCLWQGHFVRRKELLPLLQGDPLALGWPFDVVAEALACACLVLRQQRWGVAAADCAVQTQITALGQLLSLCGWGIAQPRSVGLPNTTE